MPLLNGDIRTYVVGEGHDSVKTLQYRTAIGLLGAPDTFVDVEEVDAS